MLNAGQKSDSLDISDFIKQTNVVIREDELERLQPSTLQKNLTTNAYSMGQRLEQKRKFRNDDIRSMLISRLAQEKLQVSHKLQSLTLRQGQRLSTPPTANK